MKLYRYEMRQVRTALLDYHRKWAQDKKMVDGVPLMDIREVETDETGQADLCVEFLWRGSWIESIHVYLWKITDGFLIIKLGDPITLQEVWDFCQSGQTTSKFIFPE